MGEGKKPSFLSFLDNPPLSHDLYMLHIDCNACKNHCCGKNPHLTPVLLPSEEKKFKKYSKSVQTPYRKMRILTKKENGNCIFLDDKTKKCIIYEKRPLECRLYPFLLDFSQEEPAVRLDTRFCPHLKTLVVEKEKLSDLVQKQNFPKEWSEGYKTLEEY